jgi:hypothetical protein
VILSKLLQRLASVLETVTIASEVKGLMQYAESAGVDEETLEKYLDATAHMVTSLVCRRGLEAQLGLLVHTYGTDQAKELLDMAIEAVKDEDS